MRIRRIYAVAVASALALSGALLPAHADSGEQEMYRLYNRVSHEHLYTADSHERDVLMRGDWTYEGVGWVAPVSSSIPVRRLYNPILGDHHYTSDRNEVRVLTSRYGWRDEGIGWYSADSSAIAVYRQFHPALRVGSHNYTADANEYSVNNSRGWRGEGVAWYALKAGWQAHTNTVSVGYEQVGISLTHMVDFQKSSPYYSELAEADIRSALAPTFEPSAPEYFEFLDLQGTTGMSAADINAFLASTPAGRSGTLAGLGYLFVEAAAESGINEAYLVAHAVHETGWGTSNLARGYYYDGRAEINGRTYPAGTYFNFFGIGAVDSDALGAGRATAIVNGWNSRTAAIKGGAAWISQRYIHGASFSGYDQRTLYDMKWDYQRSADTHARGWHQYATDRLWALKIARLINSAYSFASGLPNVAYIVPVYAAHDAVQ